MNRIVRSSVNVAIERTAPGGRAVGDCETCSGPLVVDAVSIPLDQPPNSGWGN